MKTFKKDLLNVNIYDTRAEMGRAAAKDIKAKILELLTKKAEINMIFAAAPPRTRSWRLLQPIERSRGIESMHSIWMNI